ncbi:MAG: cation transporter [Nitrososphaerota archaeon]|nr:cation transporter [Nitrososphaerota archaeon]
MQKEVKNRSTGFSEGERIAKLSAITLFAVGAFEIAVGTLSGSVSLTADGVDSWVDTTISFIVWLGLRYSKRAPDNRFHFGYFKVETLGALIASVGMVGSASALAYFSYLRLAQPRELSYAAYALITPLAAGAIALYRALQMRRISRKYNLLSLRTDAANAVKDATGSFVAFVAILAATFGFGYTDALGGMIIAGYIFTVAYVSIREASLILLDACSNPELVEDIRKLIEEKYPVRVIDVRLRKAGRFAVGVVSVSADSTMTLAQAELLRENMTNALSDKIEGLGSISIIIHPKNDMSEVN